MATTDRSTRFASPPPTIEEFRKRVVVAFRPDVNLPYEDHAEEELLRQGILPWDELTKQFGSISLDRVFFSVTELELSRLEQRASEMNPSRRITGFRRFFEVECPRDIDPEKLAARLESFPVVERAYVATVPMWKPLVNPDDVLAPQQRYLEAGPAGPALSGGVDGYAAWQHPGGDGVGVDFVDIEEGWNLNHEDLIAAHVNLLSGQNLDWRGHGTAVLGIVLAVDNRIGCVGLAPKANGCVASQWRRRVRPRYNTEDALVSVAATRGPGAIVLLESQTQSCLPMEVEDAIYLAIEAMTSTGITLVECAGNGGLDLDAHQDDFGRRTLARSSPDFRDSGAIMVAASTSGVVSQSMVAAPARARWQMSNYGSRVDCFAWGEHVVTTGDGNQGTGNSDYCEFPNTFGGTSAAGAIVAGAAVCLQGIARQAPLVGRPLTPKELRRLLTDHQLCTPSHNPPADRIGWMPDLRRLSARLPAGPPFP